MADVETPIEVRATAKYVRTAPRKAQLVAAEIRGRRAVEARQVLAFMTRAAARDVDKVLASAIANAEANHGLSGDDLYVSAAEIGSGPTLKRWRARARGRVGRIKKRTCHITIRLAPLEGTAPAPSPAAAAEEQKTPARPRSAKTPVPAESAEPAPAEQQAETGEAPKRAPRKKAAEPAAQGETASAAPKRAPRKKAAEAAAKDEAEPKPRRSRAKQDAGEAPAAEKPRRAPRTKAEPEEES